MVKVVRIRKHSRKNPKHLGRHGVREHDRTVRGSIGNKFMKIFRRDPKRSYDLSDEERTFLTLTEFPVSYDDLDEGEQELVKRLEEKRILEINEQQEQRRVYRSMQEQHRRLAESYRRF